MAGRGRPGGARVNRRTRPMGPLGWLLAGAAVAVLCAVLVSAILESAGP